MTHLHQNRQLVWLYLLDFQGPADLAAWLVAIPSYTLTNSTELLEAAATQPSRFNHNGVGVSHRR
jgi:hypothetical protein